MPATIWKGFISFGLVSFPVRLFSAARAERVRFHMLHKKDLSRVREVWFCAEEDKQIERSDIVKGYETGEGEYIVVEEEQLKKIAPPTATTMDILQFVGDDEVDPMFFESSYYIAHEGAAKPFTLFMKALTETRQNAIAKVSMHNREHVVLIRPSNGGLVLHTLFYPDELHESNKVEAPNSKYSAKELELAISLVKHLTGPFNPGEFRDEYRENVERLIEQQRKGQKITTIKQPRKAPVIDLMEALKRSLKSSSAKPAVRSSPRGRVSNKAAGRHRAA